MAAGFEGKLALLPPVAWQAEFEEGGPAAGVLEEEDVRSADVQKRENVVHL